VTSQPTVKAVFFDVDFTLIYPGPTFQGQGYERFCAAHGISVDPARFEAAVKASSYILDEVEEPIYDDQLFINYTASIIEHMGGGGPALGAAAREIYDQWPTNHHFEMYDDVGPVLQELVGRGYILGVISNSHRSLDAFREHFALNDLIQVGVSSAEHGYLKPHRSIFEEAVSRAGVTADTALMVGDSLRHDVIGAIAAGMRAVLLRRSGENPPDAPAGVPIIQSLAELAAHL
jgi:putative hydrolase of the HAD superfamily